MTSELPDQTLTARFDAIARAKLAAVMDIYRRLDAEPAEEGDKALNLRHATAKTVLTHIALLRKLLGQEAKPAAAMAAPVYYEEAELDAMLNELREARDD